MKPIKLNKKLFVGCVIVFLMLFIALFYIWQKGTQTKIFCEDPTIPVDRCVPISAYFVGKVSHGEVVNKPTCLPHPGAILTPVIRVAVPGEDVNVAHTALALPGTKFSTVETFEKWTIGYVDKDGVPVDGKQVSVVVGCISSLDYR